MREHEFVKLFQAYSTLQTLFPDLVSLKKVEKIIVSEFKEVAPNSRGKKKRYGITYHNNGYCSYGNGYFNTSALLPPFEFSYPNPKTKKSTPTKEHARKFRCYGTLIRLVCRKQFGLDYRKKKYVDEDWFLKLYDHYLKTNSIESDDLRKSLRTSIIGKLGKSYWFDGEIDGSFIDAYLSKIFLQHEYRGHRKRRGEEPSGCRVTLPTSEGMLSNWIERPGAFSTWCNWTMKEYSTEILCETFPEFLKKFKEEIKNRNISSLTEVAKDIGVKL